MRIYREVFASDVAHCMHLCLHFILFNLKYWRKLYTDTNQHSSRRSAFPVAGPRLWNSLPTNLRQSDLTFLQFRRALKTYLFGWLRLQHLVTFVYSVLYKCSYLLTYLLTVACTCFSGTRCADRLAACIGHGTDSHREIERQDQFDAAQSDAQRWRWIFVPFAQRRRRSLRLHQSLRPATSRVSHSTVIISALAAVRLESRFLWNIFLHWNAEEQKVSRAFRTCQNGCKVRAGVLRIWRFLLYI